MKSGKSSHTLSTPKYMLWFPQCRDRLHTTKKTAIWYIKLSDFAALLFQHFCWISIRIQWQVPFCLAMKFFFATPDIRRPISISHSINIPYSNYNTQNRLFLFFLFFFLCFFFFLVCRKCNLSLYNQQFMVVRHVNHLQIVKKKMSVLYTK